VQYVTLSVLGCLRISRDQCSMSQYQSLKFIKYHL